MMLASMLAIIPASAAPKGTKISTAGDFAAMKADGEYYLDNDIVIAASYEGEFSGKLDGNGHTITVFGATPVFEKIVGGEVINLTVNMTFAAEKPEGDFGALARVASGKFKNITATVDFKFTGTAELNSIGGIIGKINGETTVNTVVTKGSIEQVQADNANKVVTDASIGVGGIVGSAFTDSLDVTIKNSTNHVNVTSRLRSAGTGGIVGSSAGNTALYVENCQNYGTLSANATQGNSVLDFMGLGGIVGSMYAISRANASVEIVECRNYGGLSYNNTVGAGRTASAGILGCVYNGKKVTITDCVNSGSINANGALASGGAIGLITVYNSKWATNKEADIKIKSCVNTGSITASTDAYVGGMLGSIMTVYTPNVSTKIEKCANYGDLSSQRFNGGMIGLVGSGGFGAPLSVKQCYNAGTVNSGVIDYLKMTWTSCDGDMTLMGYDKELNKFLAPYTSPEIIDFVNEGTVRHNDIVYVHELGIFSDEQEQNTKIIVSNCVGNGTMYTPNTGTNTLPVAETAPENAEETRTSVKAAVPANPSELDALLAPFAGALEEDYTPESWSTFKDVYPTALAAANKANDSATLAACVTSMQGIALEPATADTTALAAAIEAADTQKTATPNGEGFVVSSWNAFLSAYDAAKAVLDNAQTAKPSEVNKAAALLVAAQNSIETLPDLDAFAAEIAKYEAYQQSTYTSSGWEDFANAIAAAKALLIDEGATNAKVAAAVEAMEDAAALLVKKADPSTLKAKADAALSANSASTYTAKTYNDLNTLIKNIYKEVEANDMSEERVNEYSDALDAAIARLVKKGNLEAVDALLEPFGDIIIGGASPRVDKDIVEVLEGQYTAESMKTFVGVLEKIAEAKKQDNLPHLSEDDAKKLEESLQSAIDGLVPFASYADLDAKIVEVLALDKSKYTEESWNKVIDATKAAIAIKSNRDTVKAQSDKALADLTAAIEGLVEVSTDDGAEKKGCKSAIGATVVVMTATLALGATTLLKKKED